MKNNNDVKIKCKYKKNNFIRDEIVSSEVHQSMNTTCYMQSKWYPMFYTWINISKIEFIPYSWVFLLGEKMGKTCVLVLKAEKQ